DRGRVGRTLRHAHAGGRGRQRKIRRTARSRTDEPHFFEDPMIGGIGRPYLADHARSQYAADGRAAERISLSAGRSAVGIRWTYRPARIGPGRTVGRKLQLQVGSQEPVATSGYGSVNEVGGRNGDGA